MTSNHTIRDVAREAGVSVATVSRVINNKPDASSEARRRVEDAITKLGYARSTQWRQLTTGKSRAISLLFPHTETSPSHIYLDFITGVTTACEERDYRLDLITRDVDTAALLDLYRSSKSDGTILMKVQLDDWRVEFLREMDLPFVMIGHTEASVGASYVDYDFDAAIRAGLAHLVALGHRNIAYVSPTPPHDGQHGPTIRALRAYTHGVSRTRPAAARLSHRSELAAHPPDDVEHARRAPRDHRAGDDPRDGRDGALQRRARGRAARARRHLDPRAHHTARPGADEPGIDGHGVPGVVDGVRGGPDDDRRARRGRHRPQGNPQGAEPRRSGQHQPGTTTCGGRSRRT